MTDRELMQQALDALEEINKLSVGENAICLPAEIDTAMDALRERLAQPVQEPVAWEQLHEHMAGPFYKAPRPWVGLTDEEIKIAAEKSVRYSAFHHGVFFAEAKLKEKNSD